MADRTLKRESNYKEEAKQKLSELLEIHREKSKLNLTSYLIGFQFYVGI